MSRNNLDCGCLTVKYLVFIFNLLFFISGLILITVGAVAQGFFKDWVIFFENQYSTPAIGVVILGVIVLLISFFGCCGASKENVCMLNTFSALMVLILVCEIAAGITVAVLKDDVEELVEKSMKDTMQNYGQPDNLVTPTWDDLQTKHKCCGSHNYTDWESTPFGANKTKVPDSCCKEMFENCGINLSPSSLYQEGCYKALVESAKSNIAAITGGIIVLAFLQMVGIWMACCLVRGIKERYEIL